MLRLLFSIVLLAGIGCGVEGSHRPVESSPQDWVLPGPKTETRAFGPMPVEDVTSFVRARESEGWMVVGYDSAGRPLDARYTIVMRRWTN